MMNHVMVDLETMGVSPGCAIISIGAVWFDNEKLGDTFYEKISLDSCLKHGLTLDASTIIWWMKQSYEARKEFFNNESDPDIIEILNKFAKFLEHNPDAYIWGNGSDFDCSILQEAYRRCNIELPWNSFNNRCFRTFKSQYPNAPKPVRSKTEMHNALSDAIYQAKYMINIIYYESNKNEETQ